MARALPWLAAVVLAFATDARAGQSLASASVGGTVYDPSGLVVPGAVVTLTSTSTNQTLTTRTNERGQFLLPSVPVGDHDLHVVVRGFADVRSHLTLTVGQAVDLPVTLAVATANEEVTVTVAAPIIDTARIPLAATITPREVDTLPLNGRNYLDLALLAPNVSRTNTRSNERFAETSAVPGTGISISGQRNIGNTFIVDGLSANDDAADLAGTYFSEEVIREFQIVTAGGAAEFGRVSAGIVNVVTQSGANRRRGRAYAFFRNDALDARNALAVADDPLNQQQYGVSYGGPVIADRTFWFGNVERTNQDRTGIVTVPPASQHAINAALDRFNYLGARLQTGGFETGYETVNVFGRLDDRSSKGSLALRYSLYDVGSANARNAGGLNDVSRGTRLDNGDQTVAGVFQSPFGDTAFNEVRLQWTRSRLDAPPNDLAGPAVNISGVSSFGTATFSPTVRDLDLLQAANTVTLQRGAHLVKVGGDLIVNRVSISFPGALQGVYTFASTAAFDRGEYITYQQAFGEAVTRQTNPNFGGFVQDEWRPRPALTVNAGLRYDVQWLHSPVALDGNNVSPRLGAAWALDDRTVVRANGGVYFDRIPLRATSNALQRDGVRYKVAVLSFGETGAPAFPAVLAAFPSTTLTAITAIDPGVRSPRSEQMGVQIERAIGHATTVTAAYTHLRGRGVLMSRNVNVPTLTAAEALAQGVPNLGRPNPAFGNINQYESIGDSWFDGFTVGYEARPGRWGNARLSYTLSRALDTAGNFFFNSPQDSADIAAEKGPSDNDQRHRLIASGSVRAFWGLEFAYVAAAASGVPFNIQTGNDRNGDTNANDRPARVARNTGRQSATRSLDLRVSRPFVFGGNRVEVMLEAFNALNHTNVLAVNNVFGTGSVPRASFGQPTLAGDPRQIQVGVRWGF